MSTPEAPEVTAEGPWREIPSDDESLAAMPASPMRRALTWVGMLALVASAVLGSNMFSVRDRLLGSATPKPAPPAAGRVAGTPPAGMPASETAVRSSPWWQDVITLEGNGSMTSAPFTIADNAIQWRVKGTCAPGRLVVRVPKRPKAVLDAACPVDEFGYGTQTGPVSVEVNAEGPWRLQISQQVDAPLVEPPLPAMTAPGAKASATGSFYRIDRNATGTVTLYRQADGRWSVRLDEFFVSPNVDLELRLSQADAPQTSAEYLGAPSELVAVMDVTAGSLNYAVPEGIDPTKYRSVVIWCAPVVSAYAAASLVVAP